MNPDLFNKLLIIRTRGIGAVKYRELIDAFGGAEGAVEELRIAGDQIDSVRREIDLAMSLGIKYIDDDAPEFPAIYKSAKNHSPVLAVRGCEAALAKVSVGIVGTRHATAAAMRFTSELAGEFARRNICVVSGMAMGTDSAAHAGALSVAGENTIAVLAGGADYIWPLENEKLYYEIIERGAIVSDQATGYKPVANNFIARNRVVAGLSEKLILGEADEKSGSVATAGFALELGRALWAIPGHPSDGRSAGPNRFIAEGAAKLCRGAVDFFQFAEKTTGQRPAAKEGQSALLDLIGNIPANENVLASLAKKSVSEILAELVVLELGGMVRKTAGGFVRV
ncbi:MAG: DNA-protecting protein DprA [Rickettsiales bacterium]|jgi:DNA processing protein|nr:DNA-protecting protein DprA [Rickettsiales bacterium]